MTIYSAQAIYILVDVWTTLITGPSEKTGEGGREGGIRNDVLMCMIYMNVNIIIITFQ